ncbi:hypothetical protein [Bradyrhizobium archetypum]|uniref:Uncharacterized protein n=1 Tax=Bradyrhizobium archetypum TaxID=2721160 RepID=A0A7Y4H664_9BRAD|nr:hypothetical protein [Bradyrhizobium archetypum]NOJ48113.1 hypothetical protein [Bradyrhizobium archetypum]
MDDVIRSGSSDACLLARSSGFWLTTEDCAQAASDAAPSMTANSRINFPARAAVIDRASRPTLTSMHEAPVQPMEDMLQSPARAPAQAENQHAAIAEPNPGGSVAERNPA